MRVDVIVCTYDRAALLLEALASLFGQELGPGCAVEVLVVDNASTDGTRAEVAAISRSAPVPVRYALEPQKGVAAARARGVSESRAEWLAFFDDDQLADPRWLAELLDAARATGARCVGGRVTLRHDGAPPASLPTFCRELLGETPPAPAGPYLDKRLPGTGNVLVHRSVFDAVGSFDASLVHGAEDSELFRRARRAGFTPWHAPRAVVAHRVPAYRTTPAYLAWAARRHGAGYAFADVKEAGRARVLRDALLRAAQALAITVPSLLRARAAGDAGAALEARCRLERAVGYGREALRLVAPRAFAQARFVEQLGFRSERARFGHAHPARA